MNSDVTPIRFIPHLLGISIAGIALLAAVGLFAGRTMLEKTIVALVTPIGLVWVTLLISIWFLLQLKRKNSAWVALSCWLLLTAGGNLFVSNWLIGSLEKPYRQINAMEGATYDLGVVLGGGTGTRLSGESQLTSSGDRTMTAARLYHAGKLRQIVCTGTQTFRSAAYDLHPREEAANILLDLKVPAENVIRIEGNNTSEEMQNLKVWLGSRSHDSNQSTLKIGIITSAWHLTRALRLAAANGIDADPLPSDFKAGPIAPWPSWVIPGANEMNITGKAINEYLARIVGR